MLRPEELFYQSRIQFESQFFDYGALFLWLEGLFLMQGVLKLLVLEACFCLILVRQLRECS